MLSSPVTQDLVQGRGNRIVQIPLEWPMRYGTVLSMSADNPPTATRSGFATRILFRFASGSSAIEGGAPRDRRTYFVRPGLLSFT